MKKLLCLTIALLLLCSSFLFTACEPKEPTAYELFSEAQENTSKLDSYAIDMEMNMNASVAGVTLDVPMSAKMKCSNIQSGTPLTSADMTMEMLGQKIETKMYTDAEWTYMDMAMSGVNVQYKVSNEVSEETNEYATTVNNLLKELPEDILEGQIPVTNSDGSKTISLEFPAERFSEIYKDLVESMSSMSVGTGEGIDFEIKSASAEYTILDGYIISSSVKFEFNMTIDGNEMTMKADAKITFEDPGTPVTVTIPEECKNYEVLDEAI